ncbi:MAG: hypothetical protein AB7S92_06685 [Parvibaculaceae bacterium]
MANVKPIVCGLAAATVLAAVATGTPAQALSRKQAMAVCRAKYGMGITGVVIRKNGRIVCREGPGPTATRKEVYEYCKKRFSATTVYVRKRSNGKWECRYYGRF